MSYSEYSGGGISPKTGSIISKSLPMDGRRSWQVTTPPAIEPVTLTDLKIFAKIEYNDEDYLLENFIKSARLSAEQYCGRAFIEQSITMKMGYWPSDVIELVKPPLISITKIATLDEDDVETVYSSDNYYIIKEATPGKLVLKKNASAPINTSRDYGGYLVEYKAGYGDAAADVPISIIEAIKLWASVAQATRIIDPKNPPPEVRATLDLFKIRGVIIR